MSKKTLNRKCCVCLNNNLNLNKLSKKDENDINLVTKLRTCISEIEWAVNYQICDPCTNLLNIVYTFRETCIKSDLIRKSDDANLKDDEILQICKDELPLDFAELKQEEAYNELSEEGDNDDGQSDGDLSNEEDKPEIAEYDSKKKKRRKTVHFTCEKCSSTFTSSIKLVNHCVLEHEMTVKDVRPFVCDRCPSRFCNSSNLLQHIKYHAAVRSNICTYCGKGFITKTDLNIHEKHHLNKREYECDECGKCFNTHKDIRSHKLVVHTDSDRWKYQCEICHKPFPIKSNYDSHMRRHTGDRKFECHLCQKKFTDKCVLQRHMRTHSNVREYKCKLCDKEYKDHRVMKVHMAKVHGVGLGEIKLPSKERKYVCHICPKAYYAKNKLTRHLYTHSGEKPYQCHMCQKKFNDKSYVKQHLRKTHNIDKDISENEFKMHYSDGGAAGNCEPDAMLL
ncbi:hypothetical protein GWI33_015356 [Rhynchophorus ferrugineus]|uniref:C2H2-type domain-containing protein n=1 Tax=Rhynchophorus ferrugineus TaxID=354439 RepID=A0A834M4K7_RHYFE|nr:hypothetical protein GWI33_015356 [Rhynchophorus ferrugineus]